MTTIEYIFVRFQQAAPVLNHGGTAADNRHLQMFPLLLFLCVDIAPLCSDLCLLLCILNGEGIFAAAEGVSKHPSLSSKETGRGKRPGKGGNRFLKSIRLGFKTPGEAIEGTYIGKKCPFTGTVSIRGHILAGHSAKMMRTIIVQRNYLHYIKKYQKYEKRHPNIPAHISPCFRVKEGDHVIFGQRRPLSKTVSCNVLKVIPARSSGGGKAAFTAM